MQVHYHIIPAPAFGTSLSLLPNTAFSPLKVESRQELDDDDAAVLLKKIRARL